MEVYIFHRGFRMHVANSVSVIQSHARYIRAVNFLHPRTCSPISNIQSSFPSSSSKVNLNNYLNIGLICVLSLGVSCVNQLCDSNVLPHLLLCCSSPV
jgi:hypothetical protein